MSTNSNNQRYVLGLDLGIASIGWALVDHDSSEKPCRVIRAGVHLFEAGIDGGKQGPEAAMAAGKEESKAKPRREARQQRRQIWRRAYRKRLLLKRLIKFGLLPEPGQRISTPEKIDIFLKGIDSDLRKKWEEKPNADHRLRQILPYRLRAEALKQPLDAHEIGRALYHLAQRRGFLSNRKTDVDDSADQEQDTGKVKAGISELEKLMEDAGAETLGEYFASIDPSDSKSQRIRGRWTGRSMYAYEFNRIWDEQSTHHPQLMTKDAKQSIYNAIFYQRPLKSQRHLIGRCSILPDKRRAPIADRLFQRFRMLQKINDLAIIPQMQIEEEDFDKKTGELKINKNTGKPKLKKRYVPDPTKKSRPLTADERMEAISLLSQGKATFTQLRKAGVAPLDSRFNFENEDESDSLINLRTDEKLCTVFGERWDNLTDSEKDAAVEDCLSFERADAMEKRGREHWQLSADDARAFARVKLEEGYASFSRAALRSILPLLERGIQLQTARKQLFPELFSVNDPVDKLPPLTDAFNDPLSPAVARALSELRGVVNALIRRYGKPEHVRIELLRDLKKGRKRRDKISKNISARTKTRMAAKDRLLDEAKLSEPRSDDIEKVMLADECNWQCPYTGRCFGWDDLFGPQPTIQLEHIWPYSRSLDNSFLNKTLCCGNENQNVKRNRMPSEAYSDNRLNEIAQRVAKFKSDAVKEKLNRFQAETIPEGFTNRHLSESQYISRKATEYIALLYGGLSDDENKRRVHATSGGLTYLLRQQWKMHSVLSDRDEKDRSDHRHHAMDAIVVALTTPRSVQILERAARAADDSHSGRLFAKVELPFDNFLEDSQRVIDAIVVSHRKNGKARGKFHKDTIYSKSITTSKGNERRHIRKELHKLNEKELEKIVDARIKEVVRKAFKERKSAGAKDFSKAFSDPQYLPKLPNGDRIRRVRIITSAKPKTIAKGARARDVKLQSNHHTVIMAKLNKDGTEKTWVDEPVSLFDAMQRVIAEEQQSLISRTVPNGYKFTFSLAINDYVELTDESGINHIFRVNSLSKGHIGLTQHQDGRKRPDREATGDYIERTASWLKKMKARKIHINYLGEVSNAGG